MASFLRQALFGWLVLAAAALTPGYAPAQSASRLDLIAQKGVLRVGTTGDSSPRRSWPARST